MKLFLSPLNYSPDNGIGQVIAAQHRYLPDYGFEFVTDPNEADIIACHIHGVGLPRIDILHLHGLLWNGDEDGYKPWEEQANQAILESAKKAERITVPSEWVSVPFKRDMRLSPDVIGHGIDLNDWQPLPIEDRQPFVLWNKNRADVVCNPDAAVELAKRNIWVVSTFGDARIPAMDVVGPLPHDRMKELIRQAGVYLSTAKETFGIGILEALASGVPVLGYAHGGILDLIQHKVNGYLVEPGDIDGLEKGYYWLMENLEALQPAIAGSVEGRDWQSIIGKYAKLYRDVFVKQQEHKRKVSVVITNFNYQRFLHESINSALEQTKQPDEIIIVDDGSTDESLRVLGNYGTSELVRVLAQSNQGVANARNSGINAASGEYIICLDADDYLETTYVETLYQAMEADRALGIAYTGLMMHFEDGTSQPSGWPPQFDFELMAKPGVPPPNCIPCAAMFRKDMWQRAGGYRQEYAPGEDVEFFLRGLSVGFNAKKVSDAPLFNYRLHGGSASRTKTYKDITGDKPWTKDRNLMPMAAPTKKPNLVRSYSDPLVSVIIPVGPGHAKHLNKALDSLIAQTFKAWEVIVSIDTGNTIEELVDEKSGYVYGYNHPYKKVVSTSIGLNGGGLGAGAARNLGITEAKAPLLFFLDADDWLLPNALEELVFAYTHHKTTFVYSDWLSVGKPDPVDKELGESEVKAILVQRQSEQEELCREVGMLPIPGQSIERMPCQDYNQEGVREKIQHAVSVLIETEAVRAVGGFDESLPSWEDWDFFFKLAAKGYCGYHVRKALLVYRTDTGTRRLKAFEPGNTLYQQITERYKGVEFMACCGQNAKIERKAVDMTAYPPQATDVEPGKVRLRYVGQALGGITFLGKYEVAADGFREVIDVNAGDVNRLLQQGVFIEV